MSVEFYREPPGKFDSRTLSRETLCRWTGRISTLTLNNNAIYCELALALFNVEISTRYILLALVILPRCTSAPAPRAPGLIIRIAIPIVVVVVVLLLLLLTKIMIILVILLVIVIILISILILILTTVILNDDDNNDIDTNHNNNNDNDNIYSVTYNDNWVMLYSTAYIIL